MGLNLSTASIFETRDLLKNQAKTAPANEGTPKDAVEQVLNKTVMENKSEALNQQMLVIKSSVQISLNNSLNETLKYLKTHRTKKEKKYPTLGELWSVASVNNEESDKDKYDGETIEFKIDGKIKNIFAA